MKKLLLIATVMIASMSVNAQSFDSRDSVYKWNWNDTTAQWDYLYKEIFTSNIDSSIRMYVHFDRIAGQWVPVRKDSLVMSPVNGLTYLGRQVWDGSTWVNSMQETFLYDSAGNLITLEVQNWVNGAWENQTKLIMEYNLNGNPIVTITQHWDSIAWRNDSQMLSTFDSDDNQLENITQFWVDTTFVNYHRSEMTYGPDHFMNYQLDQLWDSIAWENYQMVTITDDTINQTVFTELQIWNVSSWENYRRTNTQYDASHRNLSSVTEDWDGTNWVFISNFINDFDSTSFYPVSILSQNWDGSSWQNQNLALRTFTVNDLIESEVHKIWDNSAWLNQDSIRHYYNFNLSGISELNDYSKVIVFPNPANDRISVSSLAAENISYVQIINSLGETVFAKKTNSDFNVSLDLNLKSGAYLIKIVLEDKIIVKRLIVR